MRPLIGVTMNGNLEEKAPKCTLGYDYIKAVEMAGGIPILIPVIKGAPHIENYVSMLDGLLLTGGADIEPDFFGEETLPEIEEIEIHRDRMELQLFEAARKKQIPIFGICRGAQVINVAMGGTLYQDIYSQISGVKQHSGQDVAREDEMHSVEIPEHTALKRILGDTRIGVNSFHHQSVKDLGRGLIVNAVSEDGIIEGVESVEDGFIIGVQWHPENMVEKHPVMKELFTSFITECNR